MISNYFTLVHCARILDDRLRGARLREAYTQEKRRLCLTLESPQSITTLVLSCVPAENFVLLTEGTNRARANAADLFPGLIGREIARVGCDGQDRIVAVAFTDRSELRCELFGVRANVLAYSAEHMLEDCFLHKSELMASAQPGAWRALEPPLKPDEAERIMGSRNAFVEAVKGSGKPTAVAAVKSAVPKLGAVLAEEVCFRAGIGSLAEPARLSEENLHRLYDSSLQSVADLLDCNTAVPRARIYWDERRAVCFSLIELRSKAMYREERFDELFEAVRRMISAVKAHDAAGSATEGLRSWIGRELERTERTLGKMQEDASRTDRASTYELYGTLLMAHLHELTKGASSVLLDDFTGTGQQQTIALDPSLTPAQNAERYYQKSKHAKAAAREAVERRTSFEAHALRLRSLRDEAAAVETRDDIKAFHARFGALLKQVGYMTETEREQLPPFRIFTVDGGFQVLAGKSSENNDLLTTKYAKPNDLWFHARGSSGSHVVLKVASAAGEPTKKAVHQAASIAAYYSKMKNASAVPVAMTEKKFVHKPRGVPAGTVTLDREKVIFVEPKLPDTVQHI